MRSSVQVALQQLRQGLLVGLAGLVINCFKIPLYHNVDFLLGSAAVLFGVCRFGLGPGLVAALLAYIPTYYHWNHPYGAVIFVLEAAFVGYWWHRRPTSVVWLVLIYYGAIGWVLAFVFYHQVMGVDLLTTELVIAKQMINAILNALLASTSLLAWTYWRSRDQSPSQVPFRVLLFNLIIGFVLIPGLISLSFAMRYEVAQYERDTVAQLRSLGSSARLLVSKWVEEHQQTVEGVARLAAQYPTDQASRIQPHLDVIRSLNPGLLRLGIMNERAVTVAFSPEVDERGTVTVGVDFSSRAYYQEMLKTSKSVVSDLYSPLFGTASNVFALTVPILEGGHMRAFSIGVVNVEELSGLLTRVAVTSSNQVCVLDRSGQIVASTSKALPLMTTYQREGRYRVIRFDDEVSQQIADPQPNTPFFERWRRSYFRYERTLSEDIPFKLVAEVSMVGEVQYLRRYAASAMNLLALVILLAAAIAYALSRSMVAPLASLGRLTTSVPEILKSHGEIQWPKTLIEEMAVLVDNFRGMAKQLRANFTAIEEANVLLEERVTERSQALTREIAEKLREQEARLSLLHAMEQTVEIVIILETDFTVRYVNPAAEVVLGQPRDAVYRRRLAEIFQGRLDFEDALRIAVGGEVYKGLISGRQQGGKRLELHVTVSPIRDPQTRVTALALIARDVTRDLEVERHLRQSQKLEAIGTLSGGIAHDFNNILGAILGFTELSIDDSPPDSPIQDNLQEIKKAGLRGRDLVKQILAFSRTRLQEFKPTQVGDLVRDTYQLLRASTPSTIDIQVLVEPDLPPVMADPTQLHQVIMNLGVNAVQAMEDRGGLLTMELCAVELDEEDARRYEPLQPGKHVRLVVTDKGPGIDSAILGRIFDPFFTTKEVGKGTGMGLAVVEGIVKSHAGAIHVYSELGKGASFHVLLPAVSQEPNTASSVVGPLPTGTERVLLIDDEPALLRMLARVLSSLGYKVEAHQNSMQALSVFKAAPQNYDLVITDQTMPRIPGLELAQEMLKVRPSLPVILCSGFNDKVSDEVARDRGIQAFLLKPVLRSDLAVVVRKVLDRLPREELSR